MSGSPKLQKTEQQVQTQQIPQWQLDQWQNVTGAAAGIALPGGQPAVATPYGGQLSVGIPQQVNYDPLKNNMMDNANAALANAIDPNNINFSNSYKIPDAYTGSQYSQAPVSYTDTLAGYNPNLSSFGIEAASFQQPNFTAQQYNFTPQQIAAERVSAPGRGTIRDVQAPTGLEAFQMSAPERIAAGPVQQYQMDAPERIAAGTAWTNAFVDPGIRQQYMDPYMADVIAGERRKAGEAFGEQLSSAGSRAAAAGALGGTRQAVVESGLRRDYANQLGDITSQGLERAFVNAQQQYERDRAARMGTDQFNIGAQLEAAKANQAAGLTAGQANLQSRNLAQQLGVTTGLEAAKSNQAAFLEQARANQAAQLATQQLRATTGLEAAKANQAADISYGGMGLEAASANQSGFPRGGESQSIDRAAGPDRWGRTRLEGAPIRRGPGVPRPTGAGRTPAGGSAGQSAGAVGGAGVGHDERTRGAEDARAVGPAGRASQPAGRDGRGEAAEQSGQFGYSQGQQAGQFGAEQDLATQLAQQNARDATIRNNLAATEAAQATWRDVGSLDQQGFTNQLAAAGLEQEGMDRAYQEWLRQQQYPMQTLGQYSNMLQGLPSMGTQTTDIYTQKPSGWGQAAGFALAGASMFLPVPKVPRR